jgi:SAM-dependent methyltransferase
VPNQQSKPWDSFWAASGTAFQKECWSKKRITAILDKYVFSGAVTFDAGCGSGFFSAYFLSKGCVVDSLDSSENALAMTRNNTSGRCRAYIKADLLGPGAFTEDNSGEKTYDIMLERKFEIASLIFCFSA